MILHISASILLLMALPGRSQTPPSDKQPAPISDSRMRSILKAMAFDFTEDSAGESSVFRFQLNGHVVTVRHQLMGLKLSGCFQGTFEPMKANQWNRQHFSTRVYLDEQGCTSLGSEIKFGSNPDNVTIQNFIHEFCTNVVVFGRFLANGSAGVKAPAPSASADALASPLGGMAWSQSGLYTEHTRPGPRATGSVPGLLKIQPSVSLKYDPDQWTPASTRGNGQFAFSHSSGAAYALVIAERTAVALDAVQDVALANAQAIDPQATMVLRYRNWNKGDAFWSLKLHATVATVPMIYWGYFYVGEGGTVQVVTYAEKSRFSEYEQSFKDFLNGLTILK